MRDLPSNPEQKKRLVLERLRERFGDERSDDFADLDGLELLSRFLRPKETAPDQEREGDLELVKERLQELRRERRGRRRDAPEASLEKLSVTPAREDALDALKFETLIAELPRVRENLGAWLGRVEAEFNPSATPLDELIRYRKDVEYRLQVLGVMTKATQRELDDLVVTINARLAQGEDPQA